MWEAFLDAHDLPADTACSLASFGDSDAMMADLAALVLHGPKRATTALLRWYGAGGEPYPRVGDLFIVVDADARAYCVAEMSDVRECAFGDVDAAYAFVEGEGDRTLATWRADHRAFFERQAREGGFVFDDDARVVLQTFRVRWPEVDAR